MLLSSVYSALSGEILPAISVVHGGIVKDARGTVESKSTSRVSGQLQPKLCSSILVCNLPHRAIGVENRRRGDRRWRYDICQAGVAGIAFLEISIVLRSSNPAADREGVGC